MNLYCVTIQMKATPLYSHMVLFIFQEIERGSHQRLFSISLFRIFESERVKALNMFSLRVA